MALLIAVTVLGLVAALSGPGWRGWPAVTAAVFVMFFAMAWPAPNPLWSWGEAIFFEFVRGFVSVLVGLSGWAILRLAARLS